jgi:hypothetical protein
MKKFKTYTKIIAIKERSAGNDSVGDMWIETKSFDVATPVKEIMDWANDCSGKLILTIDESSVDNTAF